MASVIKTRSREPNSAMKDGAASHEARRFEGAGNALTAKHSRFLADTFQPLLNIQGLRLILPQAPEDAELGLWDTLKLHWHHWHAEVAAGKPPGSTASVVVLASKWAVDH